MLSLADLNIYREQPVETPKPSNKMDEQALQSFKQTTLFETILNVLQTTPEMLDKAIYSSAGDLHHPSLLDSAGVYIERLKGYLDTQKVITIIPDYDADGILSGSILYAALDYFGFHTVHLYTPRVQTGFGVTKESAMEALELFPDTQVIMTTDNGSSGFDGVNYLLTRGIEVLISDHHQALEVDPTVVSVNPNKKGDNYPFGGISGGVVIWKLMCFFAEVYQPHAQQVIYDLIALAGCSLVTDVMPMVDENRFIVKEAIRLFNDEKRLEQLSLTPGVVGEVFKGLQALMAVARTEGKLQTDIDTATFGFVFGPMFNTPRRLDGSSFPGFKLLTDPASSSWAQELFRLNEERKVLLNQDRDAFFSAMRQVLTYPSDGMVSCVPIRQGFVGLIAGEYTQTFDLPSIVFRSTYSQWPQFGSLDDPPAGISISGSGRAPEWFDLHGSLLAIEKEHPEYFKSWGGHKQACGISIYAQYYVEFREAFVQQVALAYQEHQQTVQQKGVQKQYIELTKDGRNGSISTQDSDVLLQLIYFLKSLEPFGNGFPAPEVRLTLAYGEFDVKYIGSESHHVKINANGFDVLYWNKASETKTFQFNRQSTLEVIGRLELNTFRGEYAPQLIAESVRVR